jgi:hypothetical protein
VRRRKVVYPPPKTATKGGAGATEARPAPVNRVVSIDLTAMRGRSDVRPGMRVEIASGLFAGEAAVVESIAGGVIPAVLVRTASGRTRRVRAVDVVPLVSGPGDRETAAVPDEATPD